MRIFTVIFRMYLNVIKGISTKWYGTLGVILTTSSFVSFILLELARMAGIFTNQYMGLLTYLLFPAIFVFGLVLIPLSWYRYKKSTAKTYRELLFERFESELIDARAHGSKLFLIITVLTLLNILFLGGASLRTLHFMDQAQFCGTACHVVMNPEWVTYQDSPHARVKCVECHVGEGVDALVASKLEGARQMILATFGTYHRPIPTPVHQLRPARETCEKCHWPEKFYGMRMIQKVSYDFDEKVTPKYTTLGLKVDAGKEATGAGIHWHINKDNKVRYQSVHDERERMLWVEVENRDGTKRRYINDKEKNKPGRAEETREFDCVDCHNRATHIYEEPEKAVDSRIQKGLISPNLPFIKRETLSAITKNYSTIEEAFISIDNHLRSYYASIYPLISASKSEDIEETILVSQKLYSRNIHPDMKIEWNTYPSHIGHISENNGCFRCHNQHMINDDGQSINHDCTLCHSILANKEADPFQYLQEPAQNDPERVMYQYLREEFFTHFQ